MIVLPDQSRFMYLGSPYEALMSLPSNGQVLTPEMEITVTTKSYTCDPFYNGAKEIQEQYMRMYQFDYKKSCCSKADFEFKQLD